MATVVINPGTNDVYMESTGNSIATAKAGGTISGLLPNATTWIAGMTRVSNTRTVDQTVMEFDTSALAGMTVSAVTLECYLVTDSSTTDFTYEFRMHDWGGGTVTTADWVQAVDLASKTLVATLATSTMGGVLSYKTFTNVALNANLNLTGFTRYLVVSDRIVSGADPTTAERGSFSGANDTNKPKLTVTYSPKAATYGAVASGGGVASFAAAKQARIGTGNQYVSTVLGTPGLVGYWRLGEANGSATTVATVGTNGFYIGNKISVTPGAIGDGDSAAGSVVSNAMIAVSDAAYLDLGDGPLTTEAWVNLNGGTVTSGAYGIVSKGNGAYYMRIVAGNLLAFVRSQQVAIVASTSAVPSTGWHHVVATKSGATLKLYIDGVDVTGTYTNATLTNTGQYLFIGSDNVGDFGGTEAFIGSIDEVALYNQAISALDVAIHYGAAAGTGSGVVLKGGGVVTYAYSLAAPSEPHSGSASLTGGGVVTTARVRAAVRTQAMVGGGVVVTARSKQAVRVQALTGGGVVVAARTKQFVRTASASGGGVVVVPAVKAASGSVIPFGGSSVDCVTGGGVVSTTYVKSVADNRTVSCNLTGGGVATYAYSKYVPLVVRSGSALLVGGGVVVLAGASARAYSLGTVAPADGSDVTVWSDASGLGHDLISNPATHAGTQPAFKTGIQNGKPVVRFDSTKTKFMWTPSGTSIVVGHVLAVAMYRAASFAEYDGMFGGSSDLILLGTVGTTIWYPVGGTHWYNGADVSGTRQAPVSGVMAVVGVSFATPLAAVIPTVGTDRFVSTRNWDGDVAEIVAYDHALNSTDRGQVEAYLQAKWFGSGSSFSPTSVSGLRLWLRADGFGAANGLTGGGVVSYGYTRALVTYDKAGSASLTGGGVVAAAAVRRSARAQVMTGGGVVVSGQVRRAAAVTASTGGGVLVVARVRGGVRAQAMVGGGVAGYASASSRTRTQSGVGGGVVSVVRSSVRLSGVVATGAGTAVLVRVPNRPVAAVLRGGGVVVLAAVAGFPAPPYSYSIWI